MVIITVNGENTFIISTLNVNAKVVHITLSIINQIQSDFETNCNSKFPLPCNKITTIINNNAPTNSIMVMNELLCFSINFPL